MSDAPKEPSVSELRFPAYGVGGDYAGARRARRAFRTLVAAVVVFTLVLVVCVGYMRYDRNETQYRMTRTHHIESARPVMRVVVRHELESKTQPNAKYIEALAAIEEEDRVLELYDKAAQLNSGSASLLINYGCRLYQVGRPREARERFREAGIIPPKNALPRYLEAAALMTATPGDAPLDDALALVAGANNSGDPVLFPEPLWHPSLPKHGRLYHERQGKLVDLSCLPLNLAIPRILARANEAIGKDDSDTWEPWPREIERMGQRLVGNASSGDEELGVRQARYGLAFERSALESRKALAEARGDSTEQLVKRLTQIEGAIQFLQDFEAKRAALVEEHERVVHLPIKMAGLTLPIGFALLIVAMLVARIADRHRRTWAIAHTPLCQSVLAFGLTAAFLVLLAHLATKDLGSAALLWGHVLIGSWFAIMSFLLLFGILYPLFSLPAARSQAELHPEAGDPNTLLRHARRYRRKACITLSRRYLGVLFGGVVIVFCAWVIAFRIIEGIYPIQLGVLVTGGWEAEVAAIRELQGMLR